jgi:hypothetical protein
MSEPILPTRSECPETVSGHIIQFLEPENRVLPIVLLIPFRSCPLPTMNVRSAAMLRSTQKKMFIGVRLILLQGILPSRKIAY